MPTYQYSCTECGHFLEQFQSFTDEALTECPVCGGRLRKVFNAVGVVFKGSGFYRNDSRSGSGGSGEKKAEGPTAEPSTTADKPAAAKDSSSSKPTEKSSSGSAAAS